MRSLDGFLSVPRHGLRWLNRRRSLISLVQGARELIPGDGSFGDPMSTAGTSAAHVLGRRAWTLQEGRFSLLSELMLAALQVADWLEEDVRGVASADEQSILFLDLRGFSKWALSARKGDVARLLRQVDAIVTDAVLAHDGVVVKRLGDGAMAAFPDCALAVEAAFEAIFKARHISVGAYQPQLRAGLHVGQPERIGNDYVGVVVNIAARLCEAAPSGAVLVSGAVHERLKGRWPAPHAPDIHLRGVPNEVSIHFVAPPGLDEAGHPLDRSDPPSDRVDQPGQVTSSDGR